MVLNTTNRSTISTAVNVRARIEADFIAIKQLIIDNEKIDNKNTEIILIRNIKQKLSNIHRAIGVFIKDEEKNLNRSDKLAFESDKLALELLQSEVMNFIISVDQKTKKERLKETEYLLETAKLTLATV